MEIKNNNSNQEMQNRVKELRTRAGLSVRSLAEKSKCCAFGTIARLETGKRKISTAQAQALASYFGVSVEYLLGYDPKQIFDSFINSHEGDYICGSLTPDGDYVESERLKNDPTTIKFEILRMLRTEVNVEKLNNAKQAVFDALNPASDFDDGFEMPPEKENK